MDALPGDAAPSVNGEGDSASRNQDATVMVRTMRPRMTWLARLRAMPLASWGLGRVTPVRAAGAPSARARRIPVTPGFHWASRLPGRLPCGGRLRAGGRDLPCSVAHSFPCASQHPGDAAQLSPRLHHSQVPPQAHDLSMRAHVPPLRPRELRQAGSHVSALGGTPSSWVDTVNARR